MAIAPVDTSRYNIKHPVQENITMVQTTAATFENGVLVPDQPLNLPPHTRVSLTDSALDQDDKNARQKAWEDLQRLWQTSTFDSKGDRLTPEQLHERR
jgi:predicted DNA-binding antitoxin AbrB/MazE fold protein